MADTKTSALPASPAVAAGDLFANVDISNFADSSAGSNTKATATQIATFVATTLTKSAVGLANVDNTADTAKPVSTAQQTALDLKANLASPTFTGAPLAPTAATSTNTTQIATCAFVNASVAAGGGGGGQPSDATLTALAGVTTAADKLIYATGVDVFATTTLSTYIRTLLDDADAATARTTLGLGTIATATAPTGTVVGTTDTQTLTNKTLTSPVINTPTGIVKGDVGLGNVDNTSDANKPLSTADTAALALKAPLASPTFTGVPLVPTAAPNTNTTQAASTAFVIANAGGSSALTFAAISTSGSPLTCPVGSTLIPFDVSAKDTTGTMVDLSGHRVVAPSNGDYRVTGIVYWDGTNQARCIVELRLNGAVQQRFEVVGVDSTMPTVTFSYIELGILSGQAFTLTVLNSNSGDQTVSYATFSAEKLS